MGLEGLLGRFFMLSRLFLTVFQKIPDKRFIENKISCIAAPQMQDKRFIERQDFMNIVAHCGQQWID